MNNPYGPRLGHMNSLPVIESVADGYYLDGGQLDSIFLPLKEAQEKLSPGASVDVFLYRDVGDDIKATTTRPLALLGDCAALQVLSVGNFGAFLDWGISKDLLLPHSEQPESIEVGKKLVVYLLKDSRNGRIVATTKLHRHLQESSGPYKTGDAVDLLIAAKTELGYKAVFGNHYLGLLHQSDLGQPLKPGEKFRGWIKNVRDDGKVDLSINTLDASARDELEQQILTAIKKSGGSLPLSDKSSPEAIYKLFRVSKKNYKRALSALYKERLIRIHPESIELVQ